MLLLSDIRDWLKYLDSKTVAEIDSDMTKEVDKYTTKQMLFSENIIADHFYIGRLDNKKDKSIGVYQLKNENDAKIALGGLENTKTMEKSVSILIHWNNNAKETEKKALDLYLKLLKLRNFNIGDIKVNYIKLLVPEPIDVGSDDSDVYERVIQATFYYTRKEN